MPLEFGLPQIAALIVLVQRIAEQVHGSYNTRRLLAEGGREVGRAFYPVVPAVHLSWLAAVLFLVPADAPVSWPLIVLYLLLQIPRYWVILTLGRYWTLRSITLDTAPVVRRGAFGLLRHPNYLIVLTEVVLLPAAFGAWWIAVAWGAAHFVVLAVRIVIEERALAPRRGIR